MCGDSLNRFSSFCSFCGNSFFAFFFWNVLCWKGSVATFPPQSTRYLFKLCCSLGRSSAATILHTIVLVRPVRDYLLCFLSLFLLTPKHFASFSFSFLYCFLSILPALVDVGRSSKQEVERKCLHCSGRTFLPFRFLRFPLSCFTQNASVAMVSYTNKHLKVPKCMKKKKRTCRCLLMPLDWLRQYESLITSSFDMHGRLFLCLHSVMLHSFLSVLFLQPQCTTRHAFRFLSLFLKHQTVCFA